MLRLPNTDREQRVESRAPAHHAPGRRYPVSRINGREVNHAH